MENETRLRLSGGGYTAVIDLRRGANCTSLRHEGYDARILREPVAPWPGDNPFLYGMPILFPVNRISGGSFCFEGRQYTFPINEPATGCHLHGKLHETAFTLLDKQENRLLCSCAVAENSLYPGFPHAFEIRMEYALDRDGMHQRTEIINRSHTNMPVLLGFHTTFNTCFGMNSSGRDIRVQAQIAEEYARNMKTYLPTGEKPAFDSVSNALNTGTFDPCSAPTSRHYRSTPGGRMVLYDGEKDLSVVYENDEKFRFRLIYNGDASGYICLEPQTCLANCPNAPVSREEGGFGYIAPGASETYLSKIMITEGDKRCV